MMQLFPIFKTSTFAPNNSIYKFCELFSSLFIFLFFFIYFLSFLFYIVFFRNIGYFIFIIIIWFYVVVINDIIIFLIFSFSISSKINSFTSLISFWFKNNHSNSFFCWWLLLSLYFIFLWYWNLCFSNFFY